MKILFEEHRYRTEDVRDVLGGFVLSGLDMTRESQQLRHVGYFYNSEAVRQDGGRGDLVLILPKVLLDSDGKAFGMDPLQLLHFNQKEWKSDALAAPDGKLTKRALYDFIYGFATWVYRAVDIYRKSLRNRSKEEQEESETEVMTSLQAGRGPKRECATFMDILLALLDFSRTHAGFITYSIRMAHSGLNKISWTRTVARTQAVLQDESPAYLRPVNKRRVVDFDEELLVIYYSILNHMRNEYGFPTPRQPGYKLIQGAQFRSYMKGQGKVRLRKIRYKYYSDAALLLWDLCYAFFDKADDLRAQVNRRDFLLVSKFETVFEAMIDDLVGDKNLPAGLKVSRDDKRIDHLYTYKYLLENQKELPDGDPSSAIYNLADSKYYRRDKHLRGHDVPKQFTYARNVIQWHMDLLHDLLGPDSAGHRPFHAIKLFDPATEGYNIIPNFFVSARVNDDLSYSDKEVKKSTLANGKSAHQSYIFWERLFDRNTYFTLHYDVNFLYVLKLYAQNKSHDKANWKDYVRKKFRKEFVEFLKKEFNFYQILVRSGEMDDFIDRHYRKLVGKVFSFEDRNGRRVLLYAERKSQRDGHGNSYTFDPAKDPHVKDGALVIPQRGSVAPALYGVKSIKLAEDGYVDADALTNIVNLHSAQEDESDITKRAAEDEENYDAVKL